MLLYIKNLMQSKLLNRVSKLRIYKTIVRPVISYGSKSWTHSSTDENHLKIFEHKLLREIFGPIHYNDGT